MKDSGLKWVGQIPEEWEVSRLKYLVSCNDATLTEEVPPDFQFDYVDIGSVEAEKGIVSTRRVCFKDASPRARRRVSSGDVIISTVRTYLQAIARITDETADVIVSTGFAVLRPKKILPAFLHRVMESAYFLFEVQMRSKGINYPCINTSDLLSIPCVLPDRETQVKISGFLDYRCGKIDQAKDKIAAEIERLEQYKKSFITEAVCGRVAIVGAGGVNETARTTATTATETNATRGAQATGCRVPEVAEVSGVPCRGCPVDRPPRPMKDSGIPWVGQIPEEWQSVRAGWVMYEVNNRSIDGKEEPLSMSQKLGIVRSRDIQVGNPASSFVGAKIVEPGDLVLNKLKAHLGVFAVSKYRGLVSPDYAVYRAKSETSTEYLNYIFHSSNCISEFKRHITGVVVGFNRLYTSELFTIKLPLPPLPEQHAIASAIDATCAKVDAIVAKRKRQLDRLDALKRSLVYEYVTGKKEVAVEG